MEKTVVLEKIMKTIADEADIEPEEITKDTSLMGELSISSMELLDIMACLEDVFSVRIPEKCIRTFNTPGDIADYISSMPG